MSEDTEHRDDRMHERRSLSRCAEIFDGLEAVLLEEQRALLDRDPEQLIESAERKRMLLLELQDAALALADLPQADSAMRDRIEKSFERCRQLNQINGGLVAASRGATEKALDVLRGDSHGTSLYDSHGDARAAGGTRPLAQA